MPSASGVYSLPPVYLAVTGTTVEAIQHNSPLEDIAAALTARLSRDGSAAMTGSIKLLPGTAALPGAVFSTDPSTGLYKTTTGIGVAVGGTKVAEFVPGGIVGSREVGELVPFTGSIVPSSLWVFPYGQTLSRTTYADLWAFAQVEIAAGNTFYNNGDGSTTFGIGDIRGRVPAGKDDMGGTSSFRLTSTYFGANPDGLGAVGGGQSATLVTANLPPYTPSGGVSTSIFGGSGVSTPGAIVQVGGTGSGGVLSGLSASSSFNGSAQGGTSTPFSTLQPTMICSYILFAGEPT